MQMMMHSVRRASPSAAMVSVIVSGSFAVAAPTVPFAETFEGGGAEWRQFDSVSSVTVVATGGPDGSAFARSLADVANAVQGPPQFGGGNLTIVRGQASFGASGSSNGAFVGDWINAGVTSFSFDVRHNATAPLSVFARIATPANNPGATAIAFAPVLPGQWTTITVEISPTSPQIVSFGSGDFNSVFGNVGNIQLGVNILDPMTGTPLPLPQTFDFDIDNVRIVPAPGVLALLGVAGVAGSRRRRVGA